MKLLVLAQKIDKNDDIMGFFHDWINHLSPLVEHLYVIANHVGEYDLPKNVTILSLGKERNLPRFIRYITFQWHALWTLGKVGNIFVHMSPAYAIAISPLNTIFKRPIVMWYAHIKVSKQAKKVLQKVKAVLSPSKHSFSFPTGKLITTGHGINMNQFKKAKNISRNERVKILGVSRISLVKDIKTLIEAVNYLVNKKKWTNFEVDVAGGPARPEDSQYLAEVKEMIKKYKIEKYVNWLGSVPHKNLPPIFQKADIFVRMQEGGGFGKSELEALASGLPVVTCAPVYKNIFGSFSDDLLWPVKNSKVFAEKIVKTASWDDKKLNDYQTRMRKFVSENHNLAKLAEKIVASFD